MHYLYIIILCLAPWIIGTSVFAWYCHGVEYMLDGVLLGFIAGMVSFGPTLTLFEPIYDWIKKDETVEPTP